MVARILPIFCAMVLGLASPAMTQQAVGEWHGKLSVGAASLRIGLSVKRNADGTLAGTLVSPDQGGQRIPTDPVTLSGNTLSFTIPSIKASFVAAWDPARQAWAGTWTQGMSFPLLLLPGAAAAVARPQEPKPPFPYGEEEVSIESVAGVRLAGTLTMPKGAGPFPALVLISGSGPQDRNEEIMAHKPFLVLADYLTRRGIAVLRYDDRGTAKSTGVFATATTRDFAQDAAAAVQWLRQHPHIDPGRVGAIGHSEGGLIAPMLAERDPKLGFIVLLGGPGVSGGDVLVAQTQATGQATGLPAETIAKNTALMRQITDAVTHAPDAAHAKTAVLKVLTASGAPAAVVDNQANSLTTAWFREFLAYDPAPALRALRIPLLALNGATDTQVVASQNLPAIRVATKGNPDATIMELPGLNHLFQTSASGNPQDYGTIEETFSPAALTLIGDWVLKH